jgi:histidine ammonia-lyase
VTPASNGEPVVLDGGAVSVEDVVEVARSDRPVMLGEQGRAAAARSHETARELVAGDRAVYGLSTGFGALAERYIEPERRGDLQAALLRSHAATAGEEIENEVVRAMMAIRAATLAKGYSGVRPAVIDAIVSLLNHHITPVVREHGSLGCSGDLAPLAHVGLALIGEGDVRDQSGKRVAAATALAASGIDPLRLEAKEGLALINGTDGMLGMLCLACSDLDRILRASDVVAAMSVEALLGTDQAFLPELIGLRPQPGQAVSAANMLSVLGGSEIVASHRMGDTRVQDSYSLRCAPQVLGACRDTLAHARAVVEHELASAVDNPVVLPDGRVASCGNFHGAPLAYVSDFLAIAVADVASIAERRIDRQLDPSRSHGLPAFLAADPGVDSGLMLAHYTAAALVIDCRRLAVPVSADNIPTSAMQEDHVSMGWASARKLRHAIDNLTRVVAIEAMTAARAIELRAPLLPAPATSSVVAGLRQSIPGMGPDRYVAPEIDAATEVVRSGGVVDWAEMIVGPLF